MKATSCDLTTTMDDSKKNKREDLLQNAIRVLLEIYDVSVIQKEPMTYGRIYDDFDGRMKKQEFDKSLDSLCDCGILKCKYINVGNKYSFVYYITSEAMDYTKEIYEKIIIPDI